MKVINIFWVNHLDFKKFTINRECFEVLWEYFRGCQLKSKTFYSISSQRIVKLSIIWITTNKETDMINSTLKIIYKVNSIA